MTYKVFYLDGEYVKWVIKIGPNKETVLKELEESGLEVIKIKEVIDKK